MKEFKLLSLLGIVVIAGTLAGCNSSDDATASEEESGGIVVEEVTGDNTAIAYNDQLVDLTDACFSSENDIREAYNDGEGTAEDVNAAIENTVSVCNDTITQINKLGALDGDSSLQDAIVNIINIEISYYQKFAEIAKYLSADLDNLPEDEAKAYDDLSAELETIQSEMDAAINELTTVQETFASAHGYELEDSTSTTDTTVDTTETTAE